MDMNRRSSKRQQKIPNHFHDSIHDLNKKKDTIKNKGTNVKNKKVLDCLDQADGECLGEDVNQKGMFDDMVDCQKNASVDLMDSGIKDGEMKACSDQGCDTVKGVDENADKVKFDSVNNEMLTRNEGSSNLKLPIVSDINYAASADTKMSYASAANKLENLIDNKLMTVPTEIDEFGNEFVVFDEELINDGSRRWQLTLCGFFVGFKMRINELRYNVRRMWSRYGLTEVIENDCGMFFFKFHHDKGMNYVVDNGPWMVNNKPLVVQK
ncbi:RNA-directed DNA polymerase, eukaryota, reverse transcriptase zinc-binding domain protein [Tanacetum coccineum]